MTNALQQIVGHITETLPIKTTTRNPTNQYRTTIITTTIRTPIAIVYYSPKDATISIIPQARWYVQDEATFSLADPDFTTKARSYMANLMATYNIS